MNNTKIKVKKYTSRERVLESIEHRETDRIPVDLGSTVMSGIMAHALDRLRKYLNLPHKIVKIYDIFQMLGEVEPDIIERFNIDVLPVEPLEHQFGLKLDRYKPWKLWDGTEVMVPEQFNVDLDKNGDWILHREGDPAKPVEGKMPKNGYYFDMSSISVFEENYIPPDLKEIKKENHYSSQELEHMAERAEKLRKTTDKALVLDSWGKLGLAGVGSMPNFLMLLYSDKNYVKELFKIRTEIAIANLEKIYKYIGNNIDIIPLDGDDYGAQDREFLPPNLFEVLYLPFLKEQNDWVHRNTSWKTFQHSCGCLENILPLLVETGIDILNPVQTSAKGMEPKLLKERFGNKITFWGGGVDMQKTLAFGSVDDVKKDVEERIKIFAPGGGFVFNTIHNIQQGTPPENIEAVFDTVREFGVYPVKS